MKVAVVLFVKNEFSDILGWIAWHLSVGFDTIFVYDDHSTDGTWELLTAAQKLFDIRIQRTDIEAQPDFYWRQRDSYLDAIDKTANKYAWITFLDGDEYVYFDTYDRVHDFLINFKNFDAIALNWCIFGSSNKVIRPKLSTPEAFLERADESLSDAMLVKSFVRPERLGPIYSNPHRFDIPERKYADASGNIVEWQGATKEIDWSSGKILHYICRSMEHYVQRIKRRINADLNDSSGYWNHFNRNDVFDKSALRFLKETNKYLCFLNDESIKEFMKEIRKIFLNISSNIVENSETLTVYKLKKSHVYSYHGGVLLYDPDTAYIVHGKEIQEGLYPIEFLHFEHSHSYGVFNINDKSCLLDGDNRRLVSPTYKMIKNVENFHVNFQHPRSNLYMSALPLDEGLKNIEINRHIADLWESFTLKEITDSSEFVFYIPKNLNNAYKVIQWICTSEAIPSCVEFLIVFESMSDIEREKLSSFAPGLLWSIL